MAYRPGSPCRWLPVRFTQWEALAGEERRSGGEVRYALPAHPHCPPSLWYLTLGSGSYPVAPLQGYGSPLILITPLPPLPLQGWQWQPWVIFHPLWAPYGHPYLSSINCLSVLPICFLLGSRLLHLRLLCWCIFWNKNTVNHIHKPGRPGTHQDGDGCN